MRAGRAEANYGRADRKGFHADCSQIRGCRVALAGSAQKDTQATLGNDETASDPPSKTKSVAFCRSSFARTRHKSFLERRGSHVTRHTWTSSPASINAAARWRPKRGHGASHVLVSPRCPLSCSFFSVLERSIPHS